MNEHPFQVDELLLQRLEHLRRCYKYNMHAGELSECMNKQQNDSYNSLLTALEQQMNNKVVRTTN